MGYKQYLLYDKIQRTHVCIEWYSQYKKNTSELCIKSRVVTGRGRFYCKGIGYRSLEAIKEEFEALIKSKRKNIIKNFEVEHYVHVKKRNEWKKLKSLNINNLLTEIEADNIIKALKGNNYGN